MANTFVQQTFRNVKGSPLTYNEADANFRALQYNMPIGALISYPELGTVPDTWLICNGASLDTTDYSELFTVIQYTFGGSGASFSLPDYRGTFLRAADEGAGIDPDARTLAAVQAHSLASHGHKVQGDYVDQYGNSTSKRGYGGDKDRDWDTDNAGGSETRPVNYIARYLIKALTVMPV